jgi:hypothetical protein
MNIQNMILKTQLVSWRKLDWLQGELKEMTTDAFQRLKNSLVNNNFIQPFNVWQDGKKTWILDGHHRKKALEELEKEGAKIPELLPANYVKCPNKKTALKFVLLYSSIYAHATEEGLYEYINKNEIDFDELKKEIDLPNINSEQFEAGYLKELNNDNIWQGMPDMNQQDLIGNYIIVHFKNNDDRDKFIKLLKLKNYTDKTKAIYYPEIKHGDLDSTGTKEGLRYE